MMDPWAVITLFLFFALINTTTAYDAPAVTPPPFADPAILEKIQARFSHSSDWDAFTADLLDGISSYLATQTHISPEEISLNPTGVDAAALAKVTEEAGGVVKDRILDPAGQCPANRKVLEVLQLVEPTEQVEDWQPEVQNWRPAVEEESTETPGDGWPQADDEKDFQDYPSVIPEVGLIAEAKPSSVCVKEFRKTLRRTTSTADLTFPYLKGTKSAHLLVEQTSEPTKEDTRNSESTSGSSSSGSSRLSVPYILILFVCCTLAFVSVILHNN